MRLLQITLQRDSYLLLDDILSEIEPERLLPAIETKNCVLLQVVVRSSGAEPLMDKIEKRLNRVDNFTMMLLPLYATLPRQPDEEKKDQLDKQSETIKAPKIFNRVSREELYASINSGINNLQYYITMVIIACVVWACMSMLPYILPVSLYVTRSVGWPFRLFATFVLKAY